MKAVLEMQGDDGKAYAKFEFMQTGMPDAVDFQEAVSNALVSLGRRRITEAKGKSA